MPGLVPGIAEATPSFGRQCPATTVSSYSGRLLIFLTHIPASASP
jgi:hypothetical protein